MSSGLILLKPSPWSVPPQRPACEPTVLSIGIPSITYRGWLFPPSDLLPRIITRDDPAGPVPALVTLTPATLPWMDAPKLSSLAWVRLAPGTLVTADCNDLVFLSTPRAVTTTSSSCCEAGAIIIVKVDLSPTGTSWLLKPIKENTRVALFPGATIEKLPLTSVIVPVVFPLTSTFTPGIGELSSVLLTVPDTLRSCASDVAKVNKVKKVIKNISFP